VPDARFVGDAAGAVRRLRAQPTSNGKVGTIGYCAGGRQAFLTALELDIQGAVDCYGLILRRGRAARWPRAAGAAARRPRGRTARPGARALR
jgi:dienelactone hydrolase